jgi:hypothetical protein
MEDNVGFRFALPDLQTDKRRDKMEPDKYQLILIIIIGILWLGGVNLIIIGVIRKKRMFWGHILNPFIVLKFDGKDWGKLILLILMIVGLTYLTFVLGH